MVVQKEATDALKQVLACARVMKRGVPGLDKEDFYADLKAQMLTGLEVLKEHVEQNKWPDIEVKQ